MARRRKDENSPYERTLRHAEKQMIEFAVEQAGSLRAAAPLLGVSPAFLITRAKALGVSGANKTKTTKKKKDTKKNEASETPNNVVRFQRRDQEEGPPETSVDGDVPPESA